MSDPHLRDPPSVKITEVLPKSGLVYSEKGNLSEVLSKPKIMPLKSVTLERIEEMERHAAEQAQAQRRETAGGSFPPPR
jgi:BBSome-interacting protein 1